MRNSQPKKIVNAIVASGGIMIARRPSTTRTIPSIRNRSNARESIAPARAATDWLRPSPLTCQTSLAVDALRRKSQHEARRNISARARRRQVAELDGLLASAVSVASRGGENAPCRSRTPGRLIAICPAFGNIARARVASPRTAAGRGDLPRFVGNWLIVAPRENLGNRRKFMSHTFSSSKSRLKIRTHAPRPSQDETPSGSPIG